MPVALKISKIYKKSKVIQWTSKYSYYVGDHGIIHIAIIGLSVIYVLLDSKLKSSEEWNVYFW